MNNYEDNYIGKDVGDFDSTDKEIRQQKKSKGWVPFETYDMIQCGYPLPDHGEMIIRTTSGTNKRGEWLPPNGMWCKVKDVMKIINKLKNEKETNS